jgi:hypothetical protein
MDKAKQVSLFAILNTAANITMMAKIPEAKSFEVDKVVNLVRVKITHQDGTVYLHPVIREDFANQVIEMLKAVKQISEAT